MTVEVWSDLICPWCGLGDHRLDAALARFRHRDDVEVVHRSFQLDPRAPVGETRPVRDYLLAKGMSPAQLEGSQSRLERMAEEEGLSPYVVADNVVGNTRLAHELLAYAASQGKGHEAWRRLFRAYFGQRRSIFDVESLLALAEELGLDRDGARAALEDHRHAADVDRDLLEASALGIHGVPFFIVDRRYGVSGAQPADTLLEVLEAAWQEKGGEASP
jgi:predicted DsbA family dithiol-disulfide isomerase